MSHDLLQTSVPAHETSDANVRPVAWAAIGLAALLVFFGIVGYFVFRISTAPRIIESRATPFSTDRVIPPMPQIQDHPTVELQQVRNQEDRVLSSYGWVDKQAGIVRIPVARALELQLERGFPTRKEQPRR